MTIRLYVVPVVHLTSPVYEVPKYLPHRFNPPLAGLEGVPWAWVTYLLEDVGIIVADVTVAQDALLVGQADVLGVPPLDNTIPNATARNKVRNVLEAANVPGTWVNTGMTYRSVLRVVLGLFQFHNRAVARLARRVWDGSISLSTTISQLPQSVVDHLRGAADDLGLDYSAVTGATTLRQLMLGIGQQFAAREYIISGAGLTVTI